MTNKNQRQKKELTLDIVFCDKARINVLIVDDRNDKETDRIFIEYANVTKRMTPGKYRVFLQLLREEEDDKGFSDDVLHTHMTKAQWLDKYFNEKNNHCYCERGGHFFVSEDPKQTNCPDW